MERRFENLKVWQKSSEYVVDIYEILRQFPEYEKYAMVDQMRRAVNSVCANIAEGSGRRTDRDFVNFLYIARGSLEEVKNYLIIAEKLGYINQNQLTILTEKAETISKMLTGLIKSLLI